MVEKRQTFSTFLSVFNISVSSNRYLDIKNSTFLKEAKALHEEGDFKFKYRK